jgi:hypothetical protein
MMARKLSCACFLATAPQVVPQVESTHGIPGRRNYLFARVQRDRSQLGFLRAASEEGTLLMNSLVQRERQAQDPPINQHRGNYVVHRRNGLMEVRRETSPVSICVANLCKAAWSIATSCATCAAWRHEDRTSSKGAPSNGGISAMPQSKDAFSSISKS